MIEKMKPEDRHAIRDKINEIIEVVNNPMYVLNMPAKPSPEIGSELKEPHQRPKSNHLEVNYIAVGYYKHEIDFGVLGSVQELSEDDFNERLRMLNTAIGVAKDMRKETGKVAQQGQQRQHGQHGQQHGQHGQQHGQHGQQHGQQGQHGQQHGQQGQHGQHGQQGQHGQEPISKCAI